MIAANDTDLSFLHHMAPDQLRSLVAHASGLLHHHVGPQSAARTLHRIAERILAQTFPGAEWQAHKHALSTATRDAFVRQAAEEMEVEPEDVLSNKRQSDISRARMLAMYRLREVKDDKGLPKYSYPEIGRAFGRDHTTVMNACRVIRASMVGGGA